MANTFNAPEQHYGLRIWRHLHAPVWVAHFPAVPGVHRGKYCAYRSTTPPKNPCQPWCSDNACIGTERGFQTLAEAKSAAEKVARKAAPAARRVRA
ncbi:hypothetical protein [Methyloversatilis sp.]|uniref:hypothetical protein n=1 Tax=Methyloversatilis sp. TaxID=2569862 RepID=UPI002733D809|nr:hypothetical protein [Methyloversatilis sp.]MDP3579118.1 hypothetical protein [Methyloversatilis sp.]